jgi:transcriptional regulator with XRE-family HTH domain
MELNVRNFMQTAHGVLRDLGRRVQDRRIATGLTQGQLAKRAGVSRDTLTRLEAGENIGVEPLVRLGIALDAAGEFAALFPPADTRTLDEILAAQRRTQRVRHRRATQKKNTT